MLRLQTCSYCRWLIPAAATIILFGLLGHKSPDPHILARYSYSYFLLLLSMAVGVFTCWWILLHPGRYRQLLRNVSQLPILSLAVLLGCSLFVLDLFVDITGLFSVSPLILAAILWFLAAPLSPGLLDNPTRLGRLSGIFTRSTLLAGSLVTGLIILEILFRSLILEPQIPENEAQFTKLISAAWPHEVSIQKSPGTFRILALSDSYGRVGGDQNYHYLLEEMVSDSGVTVEVVNLSVVDYGPSDQLQILKQFGLRYEPDLVLHGFYVGNDFEASKRNVRKYLGIGVRPPPGLFAWRPRNLLVVQWVKFYLQARRDQRLKETETTATEPAGTFSKAGFLNVERRHLEISRLEPPPAARWGNTTGILSEIAAQVEQLNAQYVIVIHPDQFQVEQTLRHEVAARYNLDLNRYDFELPQRFLLDYCAAKGISCIDLLPHFIANGSAGGLYLLRDTHYNEQGNILAAKVIKAYLHAENLLPE